MLQGPLSQHMGGGDDAAKSNIDHEALAQGHVNVIAGACMAIGIKVNLSSSIRRAQICCCSLILPL